MIYRNHELHESNEFDFCGFYSHDLLDLWLDILLVLFYKAFYSDLNLRNGIIVCNFADV